MRTVVGETVELLKTAIGQWNRYALEEEGVDERTVWVDGTPHETGPAAFADDLSTVAVDGHRLRAGVVSGCDSGCRHDRARRRGQCV